MCVDMEAGAIAQPARWPLRLRAVKGISDSEKDHARAFRNNIGAVAASTGQVLLGAAAVYAGLQRSEIWIFVVSGPYGECHALIKEQL
jgi:hypothetical protein